MISQEELRDLVSLKTSISELKKLELSCKLKEQSIIHRLLENGEEIEDGSLKEKFYINSVIDYIKPSWKTEFKKFIETNCPNVYWDKLKRKIVSEVYYKMKPLQSIVFDESTNIKREME